MKKAWIRIANDQQTVQQYHIAYGPPLDEDGRRRVRPAAACYACAQRLTPVGETHILRDAIWRHLPGGPPCPVKMGGGRRYELLRPVNPDPDAGGELRASFLNGWRQHWGYMRKVAPMTDIEQLIGFVHAMDHSRGWEHRGLEEWHLPYMCMAMLEFPPSRIPAASKRRPEWLRFFFDEAVRTMEDLWIRVENEFRFMMAIYKAPVRKGAPGEADLLDIEPVVVERDLLTRTYPVPHSKQVELFTRAFPGTV